MTTHPILMKYLDTTRPEAIQMLDADTIERERKLTEEFINADGEEVLRKMMADDLLDPAVLDRLKAKLRADELIAKNRGDKIQASIDNTHAAMLRVVDLLGTMNREADEILKRRDAQHADDEWRAGRGPYADADAAPFVPAQRLRVN